MKKMVMDILYYAKSRDLELEEATLGDYAEDLARAAEAKATEHGATFERDFSDVDTVFQADGAALASALINFLENAVDACAFDRSKTEHVVTFRVWAEDDAVHFEIGDNGTGMDEETRENMFTLFFSSKGANGTGIGLFISNQVIDRHGGGIEVDSVVGEGTTFHVTVPMVQNEDAAGSESFIG